MFSHYNRYTQEKEIQSRQSEIITEAAHRRMVKEYNQLHRSKPANLSAKQRAGKGMIKVGEWLLRSAKMGEI